MQIESTMAFHRIFMTRCQWLIRKTNLSNNNKHYKEEREPARHETTPQNRVSSFPLTTRPTMDLTVHKSLDNNKEKIQHFSHLYITNMLQDANNYGKHHMTTSYQIINWGDLHFIQIQNSQIIILFAQGAISAYKITITISLSKSHTNHITLRATNNLNFVISTTRKTKAVTD